MTHREYEARVARQIAQYATEPIHDAPPIYEYLSNTYLRPQPSSRLREFSASAREMLNWKWKLHNTYCHVAY